MECGPAASAEVVKVAWPEPFNVPLPIDVVPSRKLTVPEGVPEPLVTVAVNVTGCPAFEGFGADVSVVVVGVRTVRLNASTEPARKAVA
jgi:hypothetical protein